MSEDYIKIIATNKKARHNYLIESEYEAGMVLVGTEVKAIREGRVSFQDAYADIKRGEVFLRQLHISPYKYAHNDNHEALRTRKLLLHRYEIKRLIGKIREKGYTLVPLQIYFKKDKIKVLIGLGKGKKLYDKRDAIKQKDMRRDLDRERKKHSN
ncbi:MAG: SsrA-binding protein SmpB [Proteobacteria bacterium]|nr:SsrA-binding protein SmpB [Pseudomonadota bacterium]MBU1389879.1 SsrA-binding protein SmpB [Pseudomonadota bacterium]MBU1543888.1 SsrA-binding protein SmpB [Pseudomonadota bacterium]MBU2482241.1 SsrA-binding protein SmpB [Pseudomonadota bacterium]